MTPPCGVPPSIQALGILPPAHRNRTGLQRTQRRPRHSSHPPPARTPHRIPHLHLIPRLLPAGHTQGPAQIPRQRSDSTSRARKVRRRADARRPPPRNRGPRNRPHPLRPTRKRPPASASATRSHPAGAGSAENPLPANHLKSSAAVVPTFSGQHRKIAASQLSDPSSPRSGVAKNVPGGTFFVRDRQGW